MISALLNKGTIAARLAGRTKGEIIRGMVRLLDGVPGVVDLDAVRRAVQAREEMMSTAVGEGLAIPHARTDGVTKTTAAFANTEREIEFGAIDDKPVRLVFMLVGPESDSGAHIRMLSKASLLLSDASLRDRLLGASSAEELLSIIEDAERRVFSA